jgi:hypothetical protein
MISVATATGFENMNEEWSGKKRRHMDMDKLGSFLKYHHTVHAPSRMTGKKKPKAASL